MPFLKIFDTAEGAREVEIGLSEVILGRDKNVANICLKDKSVSRKHAKIFHSGQNYCLQDLNSTCGSLLNNIKIELSVLQSGDNIQLGSTVIEFTEHDSFSLPDEQTNESTIDFLLSSFRMLPSGMTLKYRFVKISPDSIFSSGDTIVVGRGGLLVSECLPVNKGDGILELELVWPDGNKKLLLGEIMAVVDDYQVTCIKLHTFPELKFSALMDKAERGSWIEL